MQKLYGLLRHNDDCPELIDAVLRLARADSAARKTYLHLIHMEVNLPWIVGGDIAADTPIVHQLHRKATSARRAKFWRIVLSIVAIAVIASTGTVIAIRTSVRDLQVPQIAGILEFDRESTVLESPQRGRFPLLRIGEKLSLRSGSGLLITANFSQIALTGPLQASFLESQTLRLESGTLVADVPHQDKGFTVLTPGRRFVDRGTRFGTAVSSDGHSTLQVFSGAVDSESLLSRKQDDSTRQLSAGENVGYSSAGKIEARWIEKDHFYACLARLDGVVKMSGSVQYLSTPPASVEPGMLIHQDRMFLIREQKSIRMPGGMSENLPLTDAGERTSLQRAEIHDGTSCSVYLIHCQQAMRGEKLRATIEFDRPILGVISTTSQLDQTDLIFSHPDTKYPLNGASSDPLSKRGCEPEDEITIHPDRRSISVVLQVYEHASSDQLRILVASSPHP